MANSRIKKGAASASMSLHFVFAFQDVQRML